MDNSRKKKIRNGFFFFFSYLIFQYLMVGVIGVIHSEPWPAFTLPGFKNVFDTGEFIEHKVPVFVVTGPAGDEHMLRPGQIFRDIPVSHHNGIMRHQFKPGGRSVKDRVKLMTPEGYDWLMARIEKESGSAASDSLLVIWSDHFFRIRGEEMHHVSSVPADTLIIVRARP